MIAYICDTPDHDDRGRAAPVDQGGLESSRTGRPRTEQAAGAWAALAVLLLGLLGLLTLLPPPTAVLTLTGTGTRGLDAAVLAGVSVLVWGLTAWVVAVAVIAAVGVAPGACGRSARALLRVVAPRVALRLVAVAVGASALAGTTACAAPIFAEPVAADSAPAPAGGAGSTASSPTAITLTTDVSAPPAPTQAQTSPVAGSTSPDVPIPLDWPTTEPSTETMRVDIDWPVTDIPAPGTSAAPAAEPPTGVAPDPATGPTASSPAQDPAADPDVPGATALDTTAPGIAPGRSNESVVTVAPGDTLWSLAQRSLPSTADAATVDAAWRQWYVLNRDVIGADPDRLEPGQVLTAPSTDERNLR